MKPKLGILRFLGTNCDRDIWQAAEDMGFSPQWLWYQDQFEAKDFAGLVLPGGFSYGDYLRCGAMAAKTPVMKSLSEAVYRGVPVLGICNGFQILCDAGFLPGALVQNSQLRFIDKWVELELVNSNAYWAKDELPSVTIPAAHGEGRYYVEEGILKALEDNGQIWWRYSNNPNGSIEDIAGVMSEDGHVAGLMPHPERALHSWMGGDDGQVFFKSLLQQVAS